MTDAKPRGRFVWFDLMTSDPAAAPAFYSRVTGWGTSEWPGSTYTMWTSEGEPLGGVMKLAHDESGPPHWLGYVSTPDVDENGKAGRRSRRAPPRAATDIPTVGRYAVLTDPHGAVFATFTAEATAPGHEGEAQLREFSWHELATHDCPAAFRFYERLFGWEKAATRWTWARRGSIRCTAATASCSAACSTRRPRCPGLRAGSTMSLSTM